ncbi:MAG: ABC transporter ATP-binding protein [Euryarchaeota archaeon]|nr:ABC transporter ATP-binding protein [Euryarchaeota archaeon]
MAYIELDGVWKVFNRGQANEMAALRGVSLEVGEGECAVLMGPSGSGKTSLLSIIGCTSRPTEGRVFIAGKEVSKLPEKFLTLHRREHIGFIFQQLNLVGDLTALENVVLPLYPLGVAWDEMRGRGRELLERLGLEKRVDYRVRELSGGEQQRVAIARALINDPGIIIADEPTAHLDTALSREFLRIMGGFKDEGRTIVFATHDPLVEEQEYVDRVFEMRDGMIQK